MRCSPPVLLALVGALLGSPMVAEGQFASLEGAVIVADDGTYLGKITKNTCDPESIIDQTGPYGSSFGPHSIFNSAGVYGGQFGPQSPFNPLSSRPPRIHLDEQFVAYLTVDPFGFSPRIDPNELRDWLRANKVCAGPISTITPFQAASRTPTRQSTLARTATRTPTRTSFSTPTRTYTPTHTRTPAGTATRTSTATPTPSPGPCHGDCDGDGRIAVNELVIAVDVALSALTLDACRPLDANDDRSVTIDELSKAVLGSIHGCIALPAASSSRLTRNWHDRSVKRP